MQLMSVRFNQSPASSVNFAGKAPCAVLGTEGVARKPPNPFRFDLVPLDTFVVQAFGGYVDGRRQPATKVTRVIARSLEGHERVAVGPIQVGDKHLFQDPLDGRILYGVSSTHWFIPVGQGPGNPGNVYIDVYKNRGPGALPTREADLEEMVRCSVSREHGPASASPNDFVCSDRAAALWGRAGAATASRDLVDRTLVAMRRAARPRRESRSLRKPVPTPPAVK